MKSFINGEKWRALQRSKFRKRLARERRHRKDLQRQRKQKKFYSSVPTVKLPEDFSLTGNPQETLGAFLKIQRRARKNRKVHIDFQPVQKIRLGALAYLLSIWELETATRPGLKFHGNKPVLQEPKSIYESSGFQEYTGQTSQRESHEPIKGQTFRITPGERVLPEVAASINDFIRDKFPTVNRILTKRIYEIILECLNNTKQHAYRGISNYRKWWVMAIHDQDRQEIHITFLDQGEGIPNTVKKRLMEKFSSSDEKILISTMKGEARSGTGERFRGKGLPTIRRRAREGIISNLLVISGEGLYTCTTKEERSSKLPATLRGTLLHWTVKHGNEGN
ncbi:MAG: ATP-binding protein [Planctomycetota bacterium]|nr:MAG: ATP-binding protein [Planctomycetota bacterium]